MASKEFFVIPKRYQNWSYALIGVGILSLVVGFFMYGAGDDVHHKTRFWATLLQNSLYFLLICNASMFFICATTLAFGGWQMAFRRVPEAISAAVPVIGTIALVVLLSILFGGHQMTHIYHWTDTEAVNNDEILKGKTPFLNVSFFTVWTILTLLFWSVLGYKMRKLSRESDAAPLNVEEGKKYIWKNTVWAAIFIVWFGLTTMSTVPWLWLMSIDAHWYSTMYSWYTFASVWVAGLSLMMLFVVYLKNGGYLEYTNREHIHDIGTFMFAFSIFWAYLWFSQFMLIWYANIPEETVYFKNRSSGVYSGIFWLSFILNFLAPLLLLMKRGSKRNYATVTILSVVIIFGHWLDFYQMVFGSVSPEHVELNLFDFGIAAGFIGIIMLVAGRVLSKYPLVAKNHPFTKESIIHHT
ncbi:MAG: quinol:cytochrome C oxidoreductase [Sediminibacterium sp.]